MNFGYLVGRMRYRIYCIFHRKVSFSKSPEVQKVFLFGTIEHMNYGDIAINQAEIAFIQDSLPSSEIVEIPERLVSAMIPVVLRYATSNDVIAFHGGGNMGDIWPEQEKLRRKVFRSFKNFKVISFPQSLSYKSDSHSNNLKKTVQALREMKKVTIFIRESLSYSQAREVFPSNVRVILVPDIVMSMKAELDSSDRYIDVTTFMRNDQEKFYQGKKTAILKHVKSNYAVTTSDTVDTGWKTITPRNRKKILEQKLNQFRSSKIILTDRLHGMIFAFITGTPAIIFDNNNHKVKFSYLNWLDNVNYLHFSEKLSEEEIIKIINYYQHHVARHEPINLDEKFFQISKALRK